MEYLKPKLRDFGKKQGFIPFSKYCEDVREDFDYVDPVLKDAAYQAKREIENIYAKEDRIIPYHWNRVRIYCSWLPSTLEWAVDKGRSVVKRVRGVLGSYEFGGGGRGLLFGQRVSMRGMQNIRINRDLLSVEDGGLQLRNVLRHEMMHSIQNELGTIDKEPEWKVEAEASIFSEEGFKDLDFEKTDRWISYKDWTLKYIKDFGKRLITSFRRKWIRVYQYFAPWELEDLEIS